MAYRSGTYVAFHTEGTSDPAASDIKYYSLMRAWTELKDAEFSFVNSHQKAVAVRDSRAGLKNGSLATGRKERGLRGKEVEGN